MFLILVKYVKPLAEVDALVPAHREFLQQHYSAGRLILSGRLEPRTGGVIVAHNLNRAELEVLLEDDPFARAGVAEYTILEFFPSMATSALADIVSMVG